MAASWARKWRWRGGSTLPPVVDGGHLVDGWLRYRRLWWLGRKDVVVATVPPRMDLGSTWEIMMGDVSVPDGERTAVLDRELQKRGASGWRTESRGQFQATVVKGRRPSHLLHLILSVLTLGLWLVVWLVLALLRRERRALLTVDAFGNVQQQKV